MHAQATSSRTQVELKPNSSRTQLSVHLIAETSKKCISLCKQTAKCATVFHWLLFARIFRVYQTLHPFHENTDVPSCLVSHEDTSSPYDSLSPSTSRKGKERFQILSNYCQYILKLLQLICHLCLQAFELQALKRTFWFEQKSCTIVFSLDVQKDPSGFSTSEEFIMAADT